MRYLTLTLCLTALGRQKTFTAKKLLSAPPSKLRRDTTTPSTYHIAAQNEELQEKRRLLVESHRRCAIRKLRDRSSISTTLEEEGQDDNRQALLAHAQG